MASFIDRTDAGRLLAQRLDALRLDDPLVVALGRGGMPVAFEVARLLRAPLHALAVQRIVAPDHRHLALGAAVEGGEEREAFFDDGILRLCGVERSTADRLARETALEVERRRQLYQGMQPPPGRSEGGVVVLVDDGMATGMTARAGLKVLLRRRVSRLLLAVPLGPAPVLAKLVQVVSGVVCLVSPEPFGTIAEHYVDFRSVSDADVLAMLAQAAKWCPCTAGSVCDIA